MFYVLVHETCALNEEERGTSSNSALDSPRYSARSHLEL